MTGFFKDFYNLDKLLGSLISDEVVRDSWNIASGASPKGTYDCPPTWVTDFRKDLARVDVPTLVIHGDADRILPIAATGARTHDAIKGSQYLLIEGAPHGPRVDARRSGQRSADRLPRRQTCGSDRGIIDKPSNHSIDETVALLQKILRARGITLVALVDHSGDAAKVGLTMPPTKLLIFGNPRGGTP